MNTVETIAELREAVRNARSQGKRVGFVPTMGNLHAGHMSLVDKAMRECEFVVSSIFINPLQFNDKSDLDRYPRTLAADQIHLEDHGCDLLFFPSVDEMYPAGQDAQATVSVPDVSEGLCGAARPGHFDGVATVVSKLFNMVQPDKAYFGEKDFQQLAVIRKLVKDLSMPIEIVGVETSREDDGLAMSSRNGFLTPDERLQAVHMPKTLESLVEALKAGQKNFDKLCQDARDSLLAQGFSPDYVEIYNGETLKPAQAEDTQLVVLGAAFLGNARLIDNMSVQVEPKQADRQPQKDVQTA